MGDSTGQSQQITTWLADWRGGDAAAGDRIIGAVYPDLRHIAARFLGNERRNHTLEPNALVNELWIRLMGKESVAYDARKPCAGF